MAAPVHESIRGTSRLSAQMVAQLRAALTADLRDKAAQAAEHEARAAALTGQMDVDSLVERELAEIGASRARKAFGEIEDALARIDHDTYGACEACGAPVAPERLEAMPHARYCVACSRKEPSPAL